MVEAGVLFRLGDAAEDEGNYKLARESFERGAALGDESCLTRLARLFDLGIGVDTDKGFAMRCYRRAWRLWRSNIAANNMAVLHREAGNRRAMFQWFERGANEGDGDAMVRLARCYLDGLGVRRSPAAAMKLLSAAVGGDNLCEASRDEANELIAGLRPTLVTGGAGT